MTGATRQTIRTSSKKAVVSYRQLVRGLRNLKIDRDRPVIVHSSFRSLGEVQGGAEAVVGALLELYGRVVMPTFTYKTMVVPETGPPNNAIHYGRHADRNKMAEAFYPEMPADKLMGIVAETLRKHTGTYRSGHPILSFAGANAKKYLEKQVINEPLAPIAAMYDDQGWVVLIGVGHKSNTSIHLGERMAGRKMFTRWALMSDLVVECQNLPYCSDGFNSIQPLMAPFMREVEVGNAIIRAMPLPELVHTTRQLIQADPTALLCDRTDCKSCNTNRMIVQTVKRMGQFNR